MLALLTPDGRYITHGTFGRGSAGLTDSQASVRQFSVQIHEDGIVVTNLGSNPLVVERVGDDDDEIIVEDLLETGEAATIAAGSYFYLPGRKATTTFRACATRKTQPVLEPPAPPRDSDGEGGPEPEAKRARLASHAQAGPSAPAARAPAAAAAAGAAPVDWAPPFLLLRVQGIPEHANRPPAGTRLRGVVCGPMRWLLASNYEVDLGWLLSACPDVAAAGRLLVVHGESHPAILAAMKLAAAEAGLTGDRLAIHAPPLPIAYGTHHSKAFLIEYAAGVRLVVHTANLLHCDCNAKSQGLWTQDFPRKDAASPATSELEACLAQYLAALRLPPAHAAHAAALCSSHDFSSSRAALICSWPGYHQGAAMRRVGHPALAAALRAERFDAAFAGAPVFAQFSSMGSLDAKWLHGEFQAALCAGGLAGGGTGAPPQILGASPADARGLQLVWPTVAEVQNSGEGWAAGRSIPGVAKNVHKPFLRPLLHRFSGEPAGRQRAMPHIKSFGRYVAAPEGARLAWLLLASHNLSKAAWGALQKNGSQLMVRSYELGALFLPSLEAAYRRHRHCGFCCTPQQPPLRLPPPQPGCESVSFCARSLRSEQPFAPDSLAFPLAFPLPPPRYGAGDEPWAADVPQAGLDSYGRRWGEDYPPLYGLTQDD